MGARCPLPRLLRLAILGLVFVAGGALPFVFAGSRAVGGAPLSIAISGNHFIDGDGNTVRLLGVDRPSAEYACYYDYGYANGADGSDPLSMADAQAIAAWHINAVRIPLNEDCRLGLNGLPASGTAAGYQSAIESYVGDLNSLGIYAILDLHWSAAGMAQADGQRGMPDDHSVDFWTSVATTFKSNPAVIFDLFNEPTGYPGDGFPLTWSCWLSGGCPMPNVADGQVQTTSPTYTAVGMQALVDAVRATGANQPLMLGGLSYANDLSGWLANEPTDPDNQLAASFHNYTGENCDTLSCWNSTIAPVAAQVPVVTGEFDEDDCPTSGDDPNNFDNTYMNWADQNGISYLAWGWYVDSGTPACSDFFLVSDWSGTPLDPNGVALHDHLAALATATTTSTTTSTTSTTVPQPPPHGGAALRLSIKALRVYRGRLTGSGALARAFVGQLTVTVVVTVRGRGKHARTSRRTLHSHARASAGRFSFTLSLPKGAVLKNVTVSYAGDSSFAAGSTSKR